MLWARPDDVDRPSYWKLLTTCCKLSQQHHELPDIWCFQSPSFSPVIMIKLFKSILDIVVNEKSLKTQRIRSQKHIGPIFIYLFVCLNPMIIKQILWSSGLHDAYNFHPSVIRSLKVQSSPWCAILNTSFSLLGKMSTAKQALSRNGWETSEGTSPRNKSNGDESKQYHGQAVLLWGSG